MLSNSSAISRLSQCISEHPGYISRLPHTGEFLSMGVHQLVEISVGYLGSVHFEYRCGLFGMSEHFDAIVLLGVVLLLLWMEFLMLFMQLALQLLLWDALLDFAVNIHMWPNVSCTWVIVCLSPNIALMPTQLELFLVVWWVAANSPFKLIGVVLLSRE
ncbi:hypothetical protein U1Q18_031169 [Sarracenia purpurea var. burkii]